MTAEKFTTVTLRDVGKIVGGGTPPTNDTSNYGGDIPWITPKDMSSSTGRYIECGKKSITKQGLARSSTKIVPKSTILFSSRAPIGYIAIAKNSITTSVGVKNIVLHKRHVPEFYYYLLKNETPRIRSYSTGTIFDEISENDFGSIEFSIPDTNTQKAIAYILGTLDDKIDINRKMVATLEEMARSLFKSWFVDFEPVRAKAEGRDVGLPTHLAALFPDQCIETEYGRIPEDWNISKIGDEVEMVGGSTPSTQEPKYWDGDIHWATPKDLSLLSGSVLLNTSRCITSSGLEAIGSRLLPVGSVLLSSRAPIGYLAISEIPVSVNQGFIAMTCNGRISNVFVWLWLQSNMESILQSANGSTFQEISRSIFRTLPVIVPSKEIMQMFNYYVQTWYKKIIALEREICVLVSLRDVLLPKLISGKIQVREAEAYLGKVL